MNHLKTINVAILGLGTVGGGVLKLIERQQPEFPYKIGANIKVKKILVRNREKYQTKVNDAALLTDDWQEIVNDDDIKIVIEVIGGIEPARSYILAALNAGKNVITANKDLLAEHGKELLETAAKNHCDLLFEAAVAGGIPIIRPLKQCLAGNYLTEVMGIVNGTTNYILTKMTADGMDFAEALAKATELGYAEADPTADIEGLDAARKVAIMASIAFNSRVTLSDVYVEGITKITAKDIKYARELGCDIKLLGVAKNTATGIEARVHPMLIPSAHPLATVNDVFNAVFVHGDAVDDAMFFGRGAGEMPTASAVIGDLIDIARDIKFGCTGRISCSCYKALSIKKIEDIESCYFLRMQVEDQPGVLASIASVFGDNSVSIAQIIQKNCNQGVAELVVITDKVVERYFNDSLAVFQGMSSVKEISTVIRVYSEK